MNSDPDPELWRPKNMQILRIRIYNAAKKLLPKLNFFKVQSFASENAWITSSTGSEYNDFKRPKKLLFD